MGGQMVCARPKVGKTLAVPLADQRRLALEPPLSRGSPGCRGLWQSGSREGGHVCAR